EARLPLAFRVAAARSRITRGLDLGRHDERRMLPLERFARRRGLVRAERGTVRRGRALLGRRAPADRRAAADERRTLPLGPRGIEGSLDRVRIVPVDTLDHMPAVGAKTPGRIVREPPLRRAVYRDVIVVPDRDQ